MKSSQRKAVRSSGILFLVVLSFLMSAGTGHASAAADVVRTYHFNEFGSDRVAKGWSDNSDWSKARAAYTIDRINEERPVQKIEVLDLGTHWPQMRGPQFPVQKGMTYVVTARVRAAAPTRVRVDLRKAAPPWTKHLTTVFEVGTEWAEHTHFAEASETEEGELMFAFPQLGVVWVEQITVRQTTAEKFAAERRALLPKGNLLVNGDFNLDTYSWETFGETSRTSGQLTATQMRYSLDPPEFTVRLVDEGPVGVLKLFPDRISVLTTDLIDIAPGEDFELKARVRRTKGRDFVKLRIFTMAVDRNKLPSAEKMVGRDWTEIVVRSRAPMTPSVQLRPEFRADGEGELQIAEVSIAHQPAASDAPAQKKFGVIADRSMTLYVHKEPIKLTLLAHGLGDATEKAGWELVDSRGTVLDGGEWTLTKPNQSFQLKALDVGWYQLRWKSPWAAVQQSGRLSLGVVPPTKRIAGEESPWGTHGEGGDLGLKKMQLMGVHWLRVNNPLFTFWTAVQPEKDAWLYPDEYVDRFLNAGLGIVGLFNRTPFWAARNPENENIATDHLDYKADLPNNWDAWQEYVRRLTERYKGRIKYWEVWNEPDIIYLRPPPGMTHAQAYYEMLEKTVPLIKSIDPNIKVIGSPAYFLHKRGNYENCQEDFVERLVEAGGLKHLDIFAFHYYVRTAVIRPFDESDSYNSRLNWIREEIRRSGKEPVVWNSEWGFANFARSARDVHFPSDNGRSIDAMAQEFVYWNVVQLASGIEKLFWFDAQDNFYYHFHDTRDFFDHRQPRPIAVAYAILTHTLDGLKYSKDLEVPEKKGRLLEFGGEKRKVIVAWAKPGAEFTYDLPSGATCMDYLGRKIVPDNATSVVVTEKPIYIRTR